MCKMATTSVLEVPLTNQVVTTASQMAVLNSPPKEDRSFYECRIDFEGLKCRKVNSPHDVIPNEWTRLCTVYKTTPQWMEKSVLKFKCMPTSVSIEK